MVEETDVSADSVLDAIWQKMAAILEERTFGESDSRRLLNLAEASAWVTRPDQPHAGRANPGP